MTSYLPPTASQINPGSSGCDYDMNTGGYTYLPTQPSLGYNTACCTTGSSGYWENEGTVSDVNRFYDTASANGM